MLVWLMLSDVITFSYLLAICSCPSWDANRISARPDIRPHYATLTVHYRFQKFNHPAPTHKKPNPVHYPSPLPDDPV